MSMIQQTRFFLPINTSKLTEHKNTHRDSLQIYFLRRQALTIEYVIIT